MRVGAILIGSLLVLGGCGGDAAGKLGKPQMSPDMMKGGQYLEPWLGAALVEAQRHPLGSEKNPVRADMPAGQRAYLARLRCKNGAPPVHERVGNLGAGAFGSIVDQFDVRCHNSAPLRTIIVIDMYFPGHVEAATVNGSSIVPP
jgi:hypothetical protein